MVGKDETSKICSGARRRFSSHVSSSATGPPGSVQYIVRACAAFSPAAASSAVGVAAPLGADVEGDEGAVGEEEEEAAVAVGVSDGPSGSGSSKARLRAT